jgi:hypothetical protein
MKFTKLPISVEATQWFKNGDHPLDYGTQGRDPATGANWSRDPVSGVVTWSAEHKRESGWEGEVVRRYRHPGVPGVSLCKHCGGEMHDHGWIDTLEGGHIVCPGDWIITGIKGEHYPCKPDIFAATYVLASEAAPVAVGNAKTLDEHEFQRLFSKHGGPCGDEGWCINQSGLRDFLRDLGSQAAPVIQAVLPSSEAWFAEAIRLADLHAFAGKAELIEPNRKALEAHLRLAAPQRALAVQPANAALATKGRLLRDPALLERIIAREPSAADLVFTRAGKPVPDQELARQQFLAASLRYEMPE